MAEPRKPAKRGGGPPRDRGPRSGRPGKPGRPGGRGGPRFRGARGPGQGRPGPGPNRPPSDPARDAAYRALAAQAARFPDLAIDALDTTGLGPRDAAFAHAIYDAAVRRWLLLEFLAGRVLSRSWRETPPAVRAALLGGCAQILFLDRVPAHAAVDESVRWLSANAGRRASSAANAVLRRISELAEPGPEPDAAVEEPTDPDAPPAPVGAGRAWADGRDEIPLADGSTFRLSEVVLPEDPMRRLSLVTSHPEALLRAWSRSMPMREVRSLALHGLASPPVILNTAHASGDLPETLTPHSAPGHHVFTGSREELVSLFAERSDLWAQDPASSLAITSVSDLRPEVIVDACAGRGTKTRQLAAAFPGARIVATDIDMLRFHTLRKAFEGSDRVEVVAFERLREHAGRADLVLLDVPCSNTGVLARRVEARYRFDERRLESLAGAQRQIIADSIPLLARGSRGAGGAVLYSTCSLDDRENEAQARWAARWHDFDVAREERRPPGGGPGEPPERYSDGSYAALLS